MATTLTIKRRIGSVKNTRQITKAMELVSASKMRRAQEHAFAVRSYREFAYQLLARFNGLSEVKPHPLFDERKVQKRLYIVITSNGPLAGAYNTNALRLLLDSIKEDNSNNIKSQVIVIGKKGVPFVRRLKDVELIAVYAEFSDYPSEENIKPILASIIEKYSSKEVDSIQVIYTVFKSNLSQIASKFDLLPAKFSEESAEPKQNFTNFEPTVETVLENVTTRLLQVQIWQFLLESLASEHSMRMLAMKNATENASGIIDDLTLELNSARQSHITQELAEITGGAEALKD